MKPQQQEVPVKWSKVDEALQSAVEAFETLPEAPKKDSSGKAGFRGANQAPQHVVFPGAVLHVTRGGETLYKRAYGCRSIRPGMTPLHENAVFDLGALTKPLVTTTLVMQLIDRGVVDVDRRLSHIFQTFGTHGKERMTLRHLLTHTSGYPATAPFFRHIAKADRGARAGLMSSRGAVETIYNEIFRAKLENLPGKVTKYSDIGFILLGNALEVISATQLDKLAPRSIFKVLRLPATGFIDLAELKRKGLETVTDAIVPTTDCPWRGRVLCGEVHEDNAWAMGGVAAHAGLFSNADDLSKMSSELINCWRGRSSFLSSDVMKLFWKRDEIDPKSNWALGWETPIPGGPTGAHISPTAVGHNSYTGCSLWIDPKEELSIVLLSNRIHPNLENNRIQSFRPLLHDLVFEALGLA